MIDTEEHFIADLQREDDVGLVLRGHLHVEHQLIELISALLPFAGDCDFGKIPYRAKIELAAGCGMPNDLKDLFIRLGSLRNDFAHVLAATLSKQSVLNIYNSLSACLRGGIQGTYKAMGYGELFNPSSLEPRDLLIVILINGRQAARASAHVLSGAES